MAFFPCHHNLVHCCLFWFAHSALWWAKWRLQQSSRVRWKSIDTIMCFTRTNVLFVHITLVNLGGTVTLWLVHSIQVWALARNTVLCSWARHFTLAVFLSTQVGTGKFNAGGGGKPCYGVASHQGGVEILPVTCHSHHAIETGDKLQLDVPLGSYADYLLSSIWLTPVNYLANYSLFC